MGLLQIFLMLIFFYITRGVLSVTSELLAGNWSVHVKNSSSWLCTEQPFTHVIPLRIKGNDLIGTYCQGPLASLWCGRLIIEIMFKLKLCILLLFRVARSCSGMLNSHLQTSLTFLFKVYPWQKQLYKTVQEWSMKDGKCLTKNVPKNKSQNFLMAREKKAENHVRH